MEPTSQNDSRFLGQVYVRVLTRSQIDRLVEKIKVVRAKGMSESMLMVAMEKDLPDYDSHTLQILRNLATDADTPDDFQSTDVVKVEQPHVGTVSLTLSKSPQDIKLSSLVIFDKKIWYVCGIEGPVWTLKVPPHGTLEVLQRGFRREAIAKRYLDKGPDAGQVLPAFSEEPDVLHLTSLRRK